MQTLKTTTLFILSLMLISCSSVGVKESEDIFIGCYTKKENGELFFKIMKEGNRYAIYAHNASNKTWYKKEEDAELYLKAAPSKELPDFLQSETNLIKASIFFVTNEKIQGDGLAKVTPGDEFNGEIATTEYILFTPFGFDPIHKVSCD